MIKSLTGFGSVEVSDKSNQLTVLIRSVNSRFLDIKIRGIDLEPQFELEIRKAIQNRLIRGSVSVQILFKNGTKNSGNLKFDKDRFEFVENLISTIQKDYGKHLELAKLISINDLLLDGNTDELDTSILMRGMQEALNQLDDMRIKEGQLISEDLSNRIKIINDHLKNIQKLAEDHSKNLINDYRERIKSLLGDINVDDERIAMEVAVLVDKQDVTEEIVRGKSHCEQFNSFLKSSDPIGKNMNFLLQELSREANTIGSKSPTSTISNIVVEIKSEIEKLREQVQNIL